MELIELSSINKVSQLIKVFSCNNTGSIRDDPNWTSRKNSLELIELSSINKFNLVYVSSCSNTGSMRDDPYWTSRKNSLQLIELMMLKKDYIFTIYSNSKSTAIHSSTLSNGHHLDNNENPSFIHN